MWIQVNERSNGTYEGAKLSLESAIFCTKEEFPGQLMLGQVADIKQGMIATILVAEEFLIAAEKERRELLGRIESLEQQFKTAKQRRCTDLGGGSLN